jgi:hypothetical protein
MRTVRDLFRVRDRSDRGGAPAQARRRNIAEAWEAVKIVHARIVEGAGRDTVIDLDRERRR